MLTIKVRRIEIKVSGDSLSGSGEDDNSGLELGNELTLSLLVNGVCDEHIVVGALLDTDLGASLVLKRSNCERKSWESFVNLDKEGAGTLHLKLIDGLELPLVNGAPVLSLLRLSLSRGNIDVKADGIAGSKLPLINLLSSGLLVNDAIVSINKMLLDFMGENAFDGVAVELGAGLGNSFGDGGIGGSLSDAAKGGLESCMGSKDDVSLGATDLSASNNNSVGSVGGKPVNVGSDNNLGNITFFECVRFVGYGGEVTHNVVDRDATGEGDTSLHLLGLLGTKDLFDFFFDLCIDGLADGINVSSWYRELNGLLESI